VHAFPLSVFVPLQARDAAVTFVQNKADHPVEFLQITS
jgi:hypothetical protein